MRFYFLQTSRLVLQKKMRVEIIYRRKQPKSTTREWILNASVQNKLNIKDLKS